MDFLTIAPYVVIIFACGYATCYLLQVKRVQPDPCQPALEQLKEAEVAAAPVAIKKTEKHAPKPRGWVALRTEIESEVVQK